jgi:hypothetical protein
MRFVNESICIFTNDQVLYNNEKGEECGKYFVTISNFFYLSIMFSIKVALRRTLTIA